MYSRYNKRPAVHQYPAPRRDERYQPREYNDRERERSPYRERGGDRYHHDSNNGYSNDSRRWPEQRRYEDTAPSSRHSRRSPLPTYRDYPPRSNAQQSFPSSRRPASSRYDSRRPIRDEYLNQSSYRDSASSSYEPRRRTPPRPNGYHRERETLPPPQRQMSPIRGELLPTTIKYMNQERNTYSAVSLPPRRASPPVRQNTRRLPGSNMPSFSSRRVTLSARSERPTFKRDYPASRRRIPQTESYVRKTRPSRGRGVSSRGTARSAHVDVSPIRAAGEYDDKIQKMDLESGSSRKRHRKSSDDNRVRSRSRTITPAEKMIKSHDEEALEFDEVDPDVVVLAQETRRPIQPPDVKDLRLKDAAGGD